MLVEKQYSIASGQLATTEFGDCQSAEVSVVFLHGWLDNAASFFSVMEALSAQSASIYGCAVDFPGHGLSSPKTPHSYYPFHDYIDDIFQLLSKISPNKLILVGHSLGALVASCYSAAFPDQVAGLVQIEGAGPLSESAEHGVTRLRQGVMSRQRLRRKPVRYFSSLEHMIERRAQINDLPKPLIEPIVARGALQEESGWRWRHDIALQADSLYRMSDAQAAEINSAISCPNLIILGDQGYPHLRKKAQAKECFGEVMTVKGGHHCHLQQPFRVSSLIFGLVNKI